MCCVYTGTDFIFVHPQAGAVSFPRLPQDGKECRNVFRAFQAFQLLSHLLSIIYLYYFLVLHALKYYLTKSCVLVNKQIFLLE